MQLILCTDRCSFFSWPLKDNGNALHFENNPFSSLNVDGSKRASEEHQEMKCGRVRMRMNEKPPYQSTP